MLCSIAIRVLHRSTALRYMDEATSTADHPYGCFVFLGTPPLTKQRWPRRKLLLVNTFQRAKRGRIAFMGASFGGTALQTAPFRCTHCGPSSIPPQSGIWPHKYAVFASLPTSLCPSPQGSQSRAYNTMPWRSMTPANALPGNPASTRSFNELLPHRPSPQPLRQPYPSLIPRPSPHVPLQLPVPELPALLSQWPHSAIRLLLPSVLIFTR